MFWYYLGSNSSSPEEPLDKRENRMQNFRNGTMVIHKLKRKDSGFYKCFANNSQGEDSAVMHLRVKGTHQRSKIKLFSVMSIQDPERGETLI